MKNRIFLLLLAACMMLTLLPFGAFAEEAEETEAVETAASDAKSGTCGEGLTWVLEGNTLTITGNGEMDDGAPWAEYAKKIEKVVLKGGVTKIGAVAFYDFDRLESVDFGDALVEIGEQAFYGCDDLTILHLPATFRKFGKECFRSCNSLQRVYCDGGMPRFETSCLWTDNYVSIFYPTSYVWPQEHVQQLISNFSGRLGISMGNYSDDVLEDLEAPGEAVEAPKPTEQAEEETEAATEAATEAVTEPAETQPAIVLTVPEETVPETTEAPTVPETEPETEPVTEEPTEPPVDLNKVVEEVENNSWIGMVMIGGVIIFLIAGAVIFRAATRKGGKYHR